MELRFNVSTQDPSGKHPVSCEITKDNMMKLLHYMILTIDKNNMKEFVIKPVIK